MERWIRLEAVRLWYTYSGRDAAVKLLREGGYGKVMARKWLENYAHKYKTASMPTAREPLLSDEELDRICEFHPYHAQLYAKRSAMAVNALHEAARAKDAELIQQLVDALANLRHIYEFREPLTGMDELEAAAAAGFKPSDR